VLKPRLYSPDKVRVGDLLIQKGLITADNLRQALLEQQESHEKLGEILIQQGVLTRRQLKAALSEQRWRNWVAAFVLSLGSLSSVAPRLAVATPNNLNNLMKPSAEAGQSVARKTDQDLSANASFYQPLAANPNPTVASPLQGFCHPLNGLGYLSQGINGPTHRGRMAYAYDLATSIGTPVYAMRAGRVLGMQDKYPDTGGGPEKISKFNYVMIEHDGGYRSVYVHLQQGFRSTVQIKAGDRVAKGQLIGYSGNSGWSTGPHLHIEIQRPGSAFGFTQSVPFAVAGTCNPSTVATTRS
jgi:murein DD-endopeptidase MepM/ murein hydrolase activator NlpD